MDDDLAVHGTTQANTPRQNPRRNIDSITNSTELGAGSDNDPVPMSLSPRSHTSLTGNPTAAPIMTGAYGESPQNNNDDALTDSDDDSPVPARTLRRLKKHQPHSQSTTGEPEEDLSHSAADTTTGEHRHGRNKRKINNRDDPPPHGRTPKKRTRNVPPIAMHAQEHLSPATYSRTESREAGAKDLISSAPAAPPFPMQADKVYLCNGNRIATPADLFDMKKRNIRVGTTTYTCSYVTVAKGKQIRQITKVYCCSMISSPQGWVSKPSYREPKKRLPTDPIRCQGKLAGHFRQHTFYLSPHGNIGHACQLQHGGRRNEVDYRPPIMTITAPPSWGITDTVVEQMITSLKSCSAKWWEPLPKQGTHRQWLKRIGEASTPSELDLKRQIEAVMAPYFRFIKSIYPAMSSWKVGALRTKSGAASQYEKQGDQLHRDYSEMVLDHPPRERPMSMIMALDGFSFYIAPPLASQKDDYVETTVVRGQAIIFTNEQLHAGGPNRENRTVYRLFAYVVSDEADFPNTEVYPDTERRREKIATAILDNKQRGHLRCSGRTRRNIQM